MTARGASLPRVVCAGNCPVAGWWVVCSGVIDVRQGRACDIPRVDGARVLPPDLCSRLADLYTRPNAELYRLLAAVRAVPGAASPPFPCFEQVECRDSG